MLPKANGASGALQTAWSDLPWLFPASRISQGAADVAFGSFVGSALFAFGEPSDSRLPSLVVLHGACFGWRPTGPAFVGVGKGTDFLETEQPRDLGNGQVVVLQVV